MMELTLRMFGAMLVIAGILISLRKLKGAGTLGQRLTGRTAPTFTILDRRGVSKSAALMTVEFAGTHLLVAITDGGASVLANHTPTSTTRGPNPPLPQPAADLNAGQLEFDAVFSDLTHAHEMTAPLPFATTQDRLDVNADLQAEAITDNADRQKRTPSTSLLSPHTWRQAHQVLKGQ